ncbi:MAG: PqqD family protein [Candidatus Accumulibacter meliphilus]|jgi:hypothetical protein|uniref:PqqD family protein n=1 Tax=Candidatus Accumulibacter meliphilus TaxID=2211374 RepID=A0A369XL16_9PROT|nr:MAG: PqqD family protein [Candidatus Accumulibacter meliphilus]
MASTPGEQRQHSSEEKQMETPATRISHLKALVLNADGHAFDTRTGRSYRLNPPAQVALLMMQDGKSRPAIIAALVALCEQPSAVVETGVDGFFKQMASYVS